MTKTKKKNRLAWCLLTAVVVYHANNLAHLTRTFDASQATIAGVGNTLRYFLGEENKFYFFGQKVPYQRLYVRSDLTVMQPGMEKPALAYFARIETLFREAECRGLVSVAAFIPPKSLVERERLPLVLPRRHLWQALGPQPPEDTEVWRRAVGRQDPRLFLDLVKTFQSYQQEFPAEEIYIPWDYHLTSYGMAIVTAEIVKQLAARGESIGPPTLVRGASMPPQYLDSIVSLLRLPGIVLSKLPRFAWTEPVYEVKTEGKLTGIKRVVLLGTSYSSRLQPLQQGFAHQLEKALHVPVVESVANGGTVDGLLYHLKGLGQSLRSGDLLVIEQPFDRILHPIKPFPNPWSPDRTLAQCQKVPGHF